MIGFSITEKNRELSRRSLILGSVTTLPNPSRIIHSPWSRDKPRQPLADGAARTLSSCQQQEHQHQRRSRSDEQHPQFVRRVDPLASSLPSALRKQWHSCLVPKQPPIGFNLAKMFCIISPPNKPFIHIQNRVNRVNDKYEVYCNAKVKTSAENQLSSC